jgi:DNA repair protein RecO (recombination protein O)
MENQRYLNVEAVVIKRKNIKEADKIFTIYTKQLGKIIAIAKGVRKISSKRSGHLEMFSQVRLSLYHGKTSYLITEAVKIKDQKSRPTLNQISFLYYICELVDRLIPDHQSHPEIFKLLSEVIDQIYLSTKIVAYNKITTKFVIDLLKGLGFLDDDKALKPKQIPAFIENIIERRLLTPKVLRKMLMMEISG